MNSTIDINSTDEERTNILKDKMITIVAWDKSKEMKNNANQLYLIISVGEIKLSEIKKEALTITNMHSEKSEESSSEGVTSFVKVNITDFIELFNRSESIIIKNLPDGLLKPEQIKIKEKDMKHDEMKENKFINMLFSKVL